MATVVRTMKLLRLVVLAVVVVITQANQRWPQLKPVMVGVLDKVFHMITLVVVVEPVLKLHLMVV